MMKLNEMVILLVDDDEIIRNLISEYLRTFGFKNIILAKDGGEAFRHIADHVQRIDLIISDWNMPKTDGLTFLKALREQKHRVETPFIMVTAQSSNERTKIVTAKQNNVDSYIVKPFRGETLREKVFAVLFAAEERKKSTTAA